MPNGSSNPSNWPNSPEFQPEPETPFQKWKSNLFNSVFGLFKSSKKEDKKTTQTSPETEKEVGLISAFLGSLKIEPIRNSRLVKVHYDSTNPELSAQVPNTLATNYIQQNLESRFNATEQAKDWLSKQIDILKAKVEKADEALHGIWVEARDCLPRRKREHHHAASHRAQ